MPTSHPHFDHIVIGAGSAGCVVAARLASAGRRVALVEAGPSDENNHDILDLGRWKNLVGTDLDYDYRIEPQPQGNGAIRHTRGRMLGGTGSINTCVAWLTPAYDLERWVAAGADGWAPGDVTPAFERVLGQVHLEPTAADSPFHDDLIRAAAAAGLPEVDFSPGRTVRPGIGVLHFNKKGRLRQSASVAYLHPLEHWENSLSILTGTRALRLVLDNGRAVGVITDRGTYYSDADLVVACGAFDSPTLLLRSGIGAAESLAAVEIAVHHDLPGVGEHLLDHPDIAIAWETTRPVPQVDLNGLGLAIFAESEPGRLAPDIMCHVGSTIFDAYARPLGYPSAANGFTIFPNAARARSMGTVWLRTADPDRPPAIDFRYFSDPEGHDVAMLTKGIKLARRIVSKTPLRDWIHRELFPGEAVQDDTDIAVYARHGAGTVYHPAGTCKMGAPGDETAVVDPQLRVRGLENLRVADASIFPTMIGVNPNLTCMMIGERCADFLLTS